MYLMKSLLRAVNGCTMLFGSMPFKTVLPNTNIFLAPNVSFIKVCGKKKGRKEQRNEEREREKKRERKEGRKKISEYISK